MGHLPFDLKVWSAEGSDRRTVNQECQQEETSKSAGKRNGGEREQPNQRRKTEDTKEKHAKPQKQSRTWQKEEQNRLVKVHESFKLQVSVVAWFVPTSSPEERYAEREEQSKSKRKRKSKSKSKSEQERARASKSMQDRARERETKRE